MEVKSLREFLYKVFYQEYLFHCNDLQEIKGPEPKNVSSVSGLYRAKNIPHNSDLFIKKAKKPKIKIINLVRKNDSSKF